MTLNIKIVTVKNVQYYLSETFDKFSDLANIPQPGVNATPADIAGFENAKEVVLNSAVEGSYFKIDVVGGVVNNIEEIFTTETTIVINEGGLNQQTFETVQEYIEYIISESNQPVPVGSMTFTQGTGTTTADKLASSSFTYILADGTVSPPITFSDLVKANETNTTLTKSIGTAQEITYTYLNEEAIKNNTAGTAIEITADIISSITNNTAVQNVIKNLVSQGNNVGYTVTAIAAGANNGVKNGVAIPANSFYYVDADGLKNVIDLSNVVVNATTINESSTTEQKNNVTTIKQNLGDNFTDNITSVFTGDTIKIGTTTYYIYKGIFTTTVNANTAVTTGITLDKAPFKILSMNLTYAGGFSANVTDMVLSGTDNKTVAFNVGTGKMYTVLGTSNIAAEVIIEFASTVSPILP